MSGSISSGTNKKSRSITTFQVPVPVPELPELPKIPAFESKTANVAIDDESVVSQITDFNFNFNDDKKDQWLLILFLIFLTPTIYEEIYP